MTLRFLLVICLAITSFHLDSTARAFIQDSVPSTSTDGQCETPYQLYSSQNGQQALYCTDSSRESLFLVWQHDGEQHNCKLQELSDVLDAWCSVDSIQIDDINHDDTPEIMVYYNRTLGKSGWSSGWYDSVDYVSIWNGINCEWIGEIELGMRSDSWGLEELPSEELTDAEFDQFMEDAEVVYDSLRYDCNLIFHPLFIELETISVYDSYEEEDEYFVIRYHYDQGKLREEILENPLKK